MKVKMTISKLYTCKLEVIEGLPGSHLDVSDMNVFWDDNYRRQYYEKSVTFL